MKKTMKKLLCAVLAAATLGTCSMGVSAEESYLLGDVNKDGVVDAGDSGVILIEYLRVMIGNAPSFSEEEFALADVDKNNRLDATDSGVVLQYYAYALMSDTPITLEEYMAYTRTLSEEELIDVMKEAADYAKPILGDSEDMKNEWYEKYEEKWGF